MACTIHLSLARGRHTVRYDDGDVERVVLADERVQWLGASPNARSKRPAAGAAAAASATAAAATAVAGPGRGAGRGAQKGPQVTKARPGRAKPTAPRARGAALAAPRARGLARVGVKVTVGSDNYCSPRHSPHFHCRVFSHLATCDVARISRLSDS